MPRKHKELAVGDKVGASTIVGVAQKDAIGRRRLIAKCQCGKKRTGLESDLRRSSRCRSCAAVHRTVGAASG